MGRMKKKQGWDGAGMAGGVRPTSAVLTPPPPRLAGVALARNHEATARAIHGLVAVAAGRPPTDGPCMREVRFAPRTGRAYVWPGPWPDGEGPDIDRDGHEYITLTALPHALGAADAGALSRHAVMAHQQLRKFWDV